MLFNSFEFLIFFPLVTILYYILQHKYRWFLLLSASCYFYMAFVPIYILILGATIVIDYFAGIYIENAEDKKRTLFLTISLIANIGVLAVFKYYNFINDNITILTNFLGHSNQIPYLNILLPIGLSFHTFQAMSYTIEVYRGNQKAEKHFGIYSLYVMFYPQLVAGPIERPQNMLRQFYEKHSFNPSNIAEGLKLMMWGFFKKIVIADRLAIYSNEVFNNTTEYTGFFLITAVIFFTFQIFCDFSGYSDIALGSAQVMGFKLMKNFDLPYSARSITDFWRRWHISLSTWLKDYLYIDIALKRRNWGNYGIAYALIITFFISGLWHGASWTFVIWGLLHGLALSYEILTKKWRKNLSKKIPDFIFNKLTVFLTFAFCAFTYIFFRANNLTDASYIITNMFKGIIPQLRDIGWAIKAFLSGEIGLDFDVLRNGSIIGTFREFLFSFSLIIMMELIHYLHRKYNLKALLSNQKTPLRWSFYYLVVIFIILTGIFQTNTFIYFQF